MVCVQKNDFLEPEKLFFSIRPYKGSRRKKKETQRGIANLTYKE